MTDITYTQVDDLQLYTVLLKQYKAVVRISTSLVALPQLTKSRSLNVSNIFK